MTFPEFTGLWHFENAIKGAKDVLDDSDVDASHTEDDYAEATGCT